MDVLSTHDFATPAQLATLCQVQPPAISKALKQLEDQSLVINESGFRPNILRLSAQGARVMDTRQPAGRRTPSASVQQHACHRNEAGLLLARKYPGFHWTPKAQLLAHGLRPAIGEHGAIDRAGLSILVLLDDYVMAPGRILRTWQRRHTPDIAYTRDPTGRRWCDLANHFIVVTNSRQQADRHRAWIESYNRQCKDTVDRLPDIELLTIEPLWRLY